MIYWNHSSPLSTDDEINQEYKLLRIIDLHEIHKVVQVTSKHKYKFVFAFVTAKRMYYVQANDQQDMDDWFKLVNQAKEDLRLYDADDDISSIDRDQEFAKDVITSYKSNHAANIMQNQRRQSSGTYDNSARSIVAGVLPAAAATAGGGGGTLAASPPSLSNNEIISKIKPVDIPKHKKQTAALSNSHSTPLSEYALGHTYPLSPSSDHTNQMSVIEGIASSEDDEEYSVDKANIQSEESRNRVLIEGYLLKLGRNKVCYNNTCKRMGWLIKQPCRAGESVGSCYEQIRWHTTKTTKSTHHIALSHFTTLSIHWRSTL